MRNLARLHVSLRLHSFVYLCVFYLYQKLREISSTVFNGKRRRQASTSIKLYRLIPLILSSLPMPCRQLLLMFTWLRLIVIWKARSLFSTAGWKTKIVLSWMLVWTVQIVILGVSLSYRPGQQDFEIELVWCIDTCFVDSDELSMCVLTASKSKFARFSNWCHFSCLINEWLAKLASLKVYFWIPSW